MQLLFRGLVSPMVAIMGRVTEKVRKWMMGFGFLAIFCLFCAVRILRVNPWHRHYIAILVACFLWLVIWSLGGRPVKLKWNVPLALSWYALCAAMALSSMEVPKKYFGVEALLMVAFPLLAYVWQGGAMPEKWKECFVGCIRLSFLGSSLYTFLFRPFTEGMRYSGFLINPNMFGMYLVTVNCVYLSYLDKQLEENKKMSVCWPVYIELGLNVFLMYMTQSRTALLSSVVLFCGWFVMRLRFSLVEKKQGLFVRRVGLACVAILCTFPVFYLGLRAIPQVVNHPVRYEKDALFAGRAKPGRTALAASEPRTAASGGLACDVPAPVMEDSTLSRVWRAFTDPENDDVSTGRIAIYGAYFRDVNLEGHRAVGQKIGGVPVAHAHDNALQMAYTYGGVAGVLYLLLEIVGLYYAIRYYARFRKKGVLAFFPLAVVGSFTVMTVTECVFLPYVFPAFVFWFVMSWLLYDEGGREAQRSNKRKKV